MDTGIRIEWNRHDKREEGNNINRTYPTETCVYKVIQEKINIIRTDWPFGIAMMIIGKWNSGTI